MASREAILQAAVRVIGREGLWGASLAAVAAEAGASKPAVLYHFGSREKLLREVAILAVGVFRSVLQSAQAETLPPRDRTAASVAALFTAENRTLMVCVHELMGLGMRDAEIGALMTRSLEETAVGPAKTLEKQHGLQALSVARSLIMAVQGHVELWLCAGSEADPKPYVEAATRTALAIAAPPTVR